MYWRFFPHKLAQRRINDVRALHDILSHQAGDLEDIMIKLKDFCEPLTVALEI